RRELELECRGSSCWPRPRSLALAKVRRQPRPLAGNDARLRHSCEHSATRLRGIPLEGVPRVILILQASPLAEAPHERSIEANPVESGARAGAVSFVRRLREGAHHPPRFDGHRRGSSGAPRLKRLVAPAGLTPLRPSLRPARP